MLSTASPLRGAAALSLATAALTFLLVVLGNLVRNTDSGLSYLSWPLYNGRLIPDREFHVLMEFSHRAVAGALSVLLLVLAVEVFRRREARARVGTLTAAALGLLAVQILLGALTVWKLLAPAVVTSHLATAVLLFATVVAIHVRARWGSEPRPAGALAGQPRGLRGTMAFAAFAVYLQVILGGLVSTQHAGLAAPDFPKLNGEWFPPMVGLVAVQAVHRFGAYALTLILLLVAWRAHGSPQREVRAGARLAVALVLVQVVLGALNVLWRIPAWLSALHLANAEAILATCVVTALRAAPAAASEPVRGHASRVAVAR
ncbi:MAG: COX15/CtaA family protein [Candidatus Eisenbacteria bacterium]|nr:COX15/CtaA family protein [Candidatus Eisenbacteria bacterium]